MTNLIRLLQKKDRVLAKQIQKVVAAELAINFRNKNQVVLYECELSGQISDGFWENSKPRNHWKQMTSAKAKVGTPLGPVGFRPMRTYNFANAQLLEVVGDRMLYWVRLYTAFPSLRPEDHWSYDYSTETSVEEILKEASHQKYYADKLAKFKQAVGISSDEELQGVLDKINSVSYSMGNLRKDLKDMSRIVRGDFLTEQQ